MIPMNRLEELEVHRKNTRKMAALQAEYEPELSYAKPVRGGISLVSHAVDKASVRFWKLVVLLSFLINEDILPVVYFLLANSLLAHSSLIRTLLIYVYVEGIYLRVDIFLLKVISQGSLVYLTLFETFSLVVISPSNYSFGLPPSPPPEKKKVEYLRQ